MSGQSQAASSAQEVLARWERLPRWPFPLRLLAIVGIGYFVAFVDILNIGVALPAISAAWHLTEVPALVISIGLIGYIIGALGVSSFVSDQFGRRPALLLTGWIIGVGSILSGLATSVPVLEVGRFIVGMGIGSAISQVTVYIGELSPAKIRGRMTAIANIFAFTGAAATPFIGLALIPHWSLGWRVLLILPALGSLIMLLRARDLVETPRWLVSHGRLSDAEVLVDTVERRLSAEGVVLSVVEPLAVPQAASASWKTLGQRDSIVYLLLFFVVWFMDYVGTYAYLGLGTTFIARQGYGIGTSIAFVAVGGLGQLVAPFVCTAVNDRWQRKYWAAIWGVLDAVAFAVMGSAPSAPVLMVFGFLAFFFNVAFTVTTYTLTAEHYPTGVRSTAMAMGDGLGHLGGAVGPVIALAMYTTHGFQGAFLVMAVAECSAGLLVLLSRRTTGRVLT